MSEPLHDPKLKEAVKRLWYEPAAPPELRHRIQRSLQPQPRSTWIGYALAAFVLLTFTLATWTGSPSPDHRLPQAVATDLIDTHDACCLAPDHHLLCGVKGDDYRLISFILNKDLQIPVIAQPLQGWTFMGAGECPVYGHPSGHLLYRNGSQRLSVFSIPANDFSLGSQPRDYAQIDGSHRLAGFVQDGGLYCVVADSPDGSFTPADAIKIRNQLQQSFAQSTIPIGPASPAHASTPANLSVAAVP